MPQKFYTFTNQNRTSTLAAHVLLAGTSRDRRRGLLDASTLEENSGLWIIPCEAIHTFFMKLPIDSVFLDKQLRVQKLRSDLQPFRIASCLRAHSVLELSPGTIARSQTQIGDHLACTSLQSN